MSRTAPPASVTVSPGARTPLPGAAVRAGRGLPQAPEASRPVPARLSGPTSRGRGRGSGTQGWNRPRAAPRTSPPPEPAGAPTPARGPGSRTHAEARGAAAGVGGGGAYGASPGAGRGGAEVFGGTRRPTGLVGRDLGEGGAGWKGLGRGRGLERNGGRSNSKVGAVERIRG